MAASLPRLYFIFSTTLLFSSVFAAGLDGLNTDAARTVLYELQVQSANACRVDTGTPEQRRACQAKLAPAYSRFNYTSARGGPDKNSCSQIPYLEEFKLGTFEDLQNDTDDFRKGITLKYIQNRLGPVTVWLQPPFPHNERFNLPYYCDNTGSPYAVRDYMHAQGKLSRACITAGRDENSAEDNNEVLACWGTDSLESVIQEAHRRGLKVMLDVAFNHFGHNYNFYDYESFTPTRDRIRANEDLNALWNFDRTEQNYLLYPQIIDTEARLDQAANQSENGQLSANAQAIRAARESLTIHCDAQNVTLSGDKLVRAFGMWREMLDWERARFKCGEALYLEFAAPGFYYGGRDERGPRPAADLNSIFNDPEWVDVKFLNVHDLNAGGDAEAQRRYQTTLRNREYLFRILNYWVSKGVDGFRLDHTSDYNSGIGPNLWKYVISKTTFYARKRWENQGRHGAYHAPVFLAEEFNDQGPMTGVVDLMTEGYIGDMKHGIFRNTNHVEEVIERMNRFNQQNYVMRALENHDEPRAIHAFRRLSNLSDPNSASNPDPYITAGFWGAGAVSPGVPMIHAGQEFGEPDQLAFKRSDFIRRRFENNADADSIIQFYGDMVRARLSPSNRALTSWNRWYLRTTGNFGNSDAQQIDQRIFAQARWQDAQGGDPNNVVFTFNNLWPTPEERVSQEYFIAPELAAKLSIRDDLRYKLVNIISGQQAGACRSGAELKWSLPIIMEREERIQWLRLEICN